MVPRLRTCGSPIRPASVGQRGDRALCTSAEARDRPRARHRADGDAAAADPDRRPVRQRRRDRRGRPAKPAASSWSGAGSCRRRAAVLSSLAAEQADHLGDRWPGAGSRKSFIVRRSLIRLRAAIARSWNDAPDAVWRSRHVDMRARRDATSASTTALITVAGEPMVPTSPQPFDAEAGCACTASTWVSIFIFGMLSARGMRSP